MCFSAKASFTAAAFLSIVGAANIKQITSFKQLPFAIIPFIFAFQQLVEGFLWVSHSHPIQFEEYAYLETYFYLAFAFLVWPIWIPFAFIMLEKEQWRLYVLYGLLIMGILFDGYVLYQYFVYDPDVDVNIVNRHIQYVLPPFSLGISFFYYLPVLLPGFFSSYKFAQALAAANYIAFFIALYFFETAFISVWCFFAALASLFTWIILYCNNPANQGHGVDIK